MSGSEPLGLPEPARHRPAVRRIAGALLLVAVVVPYAFTLSSAWSRLGGDISAANRERSGVSALRPFVSLLAATTDAQSSAIVTGQIDTGALRAAIDAADAADTRLGVTLGTDRRWTDLRSRLDYVIASTPRGAAAFTAFSQLVDLEMALITAIGDSSGLRLDPEVDSRYLVDATAVQIPGMLVAGGRIPDLSWIVEQRRTAKTDTAAVVVAQADVRQYLGQLDDGLRKGFDSTTNRTLGPDLLRQLDQLRDAVTALSPPASAIGAPPVITSTAVAQESRQKLRTAALEASSAALDQLDELLRARLNGLTGERRTVLAVTGGGLALAVAVVWIMAPRRRPDPLEPPADGHESVDTPFETRFDTPYGALGGGWPGGPTDDATGDRTDGRTDAPSGWGLRDDRDDDDWEADGPLEARRRAEARQLIRVGRAVTSSRKEAVPPQPEEDR